MTETGRRIKNKLFIFIINSITILVRVNLLEICTVLYFSFDFITVVLFYPEAYYRNTFLSPEYEFKPHCIVVQAY